MDTNKSTLAELAEVLDRTAQRVVDEGTPSRSETLEAMAAATRGLCPGAAAALVDWHGSEIARLRAFGIVHGVALRDLSSDMQYDLMRQIVRASTHELAA
jgi:hypothetical protein